MDKLPPGFYRKGALIKNGYTFNKFSSKGLTPGEISFRFFRTFAHAAYVEKCLFMHLKVATPKHLIKMQREPISMNERDYVRGGIRNPEFVMTLFELTSDSPTVGDAIRNPKHLKKYETAKAKRVVQRDRKRGSEHESVLPSLLHEGRCITIEYQRSSGT